MLVLSVLVSFTFCGCDSDDVQPPTQIEILNGDVEAGIVVPEGWFTSVGQVNYKVTWTEEEFLSPMKSLKISAQTLDSINFAFWGQSNDLILPDGRNITFKVYLKGDLAGDGVEILLRGDDINGSSINAERSSRFSGNFDWTEHSLQLTNVDNDVKSLIIFLIYLPNTTGDVYFDDASLTY